MAQHFKLASVSLSKIQNWWLHTGAVLPRLVRIIYSVVVPDMRFDTVVVHTTTSSSYRLFSVQHRLSGRQHHGRVELIIEASPFKQFQWSMRQGPSRGHRSPMKTVVASNVQDADKADLVTSTSSLHRYRPDSIHISRQSRQGSVRKAYPMES